MTKITDRASRRFSSLYPRIPSSTILSANTVLESDSGSAHRGSSNLQVKLENEKDIFNPDYKLPGSPDSLPYRKIWDVSFYNNKAELVSLHEIAKSGPFIGVASAEKSEGIKEKFRNRNFKISLHPVIEYSLELPYGRQARIWVTTETACYRIMSVSANYISYWQSFYEMVCFAGHVVNILLNYRGPVMIVKLILKVSKLSGKTPEETYELFKNHRKFIQDLLKDQNLSAKIRKEYNALQSNPATWEINWEDHLAAFEKKPEKKEPMNILSFFRSRSDENDTRSLNSSSSNSVSSAQSSRKTASNFDDSSSLLSISEDESATYIESPYETLDEPEPENPTDRIIQNYIGSSFSSSGFLEWKLPEIISFKESHYSCPLCKITFKTHEKDCISAFSLHLRAHGADIESRSTKKADANPELDFESRFSNFRNNLQKLISGKFAYTPIPLKFDKIISVFSAEISERPFSQYAILESEESFSVSTVVNPIRVLKFSANVGTSPAPRPTASTTAAPVPKKPRTKKQAAPKPATTSVDAISSTEVSLLTSPSSSTTSSASAVQSQPASPIVSGNFNLPDVSGNSYLNPSALVLSQSMSTLPLNMSKNVSSVLSGAASPMRPVSVPQATVNYSALAQQSTLTNAAAPANPAAVSPPKSIIILDREGSDEAQIQPDYNSAFKRPSSAVPVPIELLASDDSIVTPPVPGLHDLNMSYAADGKQFGCAHYKVNCKFYAECCGKWFPCRFCHDDVSDHKFKRHETRFCLCMFCGTSQKAAGICSNPNCKSVLAHYFCNSCKFWDNDSNKLIYHCEKCGICRTGLKGNYAHCDRCGKCVAKAMFNGHSCYPVERQINTINQIIVPSNITNVASDPAGSEKRTKLDLPVESNGNISAPQQFQNVPKLASGPAENIKTSVDQANYVNYLKNSLTYWRNKGPTAPAESAQRRNCWNCMNSLPNSYDGSGNSKYCLHCSAIIE